MKLLLTMGALFQTIAALWLAKVVFASGRRVTAGEAQLPHGIGTAIRYVYTVPYPGLRWLG